MTVTKFWRCPKCGYLVTDIECRNIMFDPECRNIIFDPECRCYEETGMTWSRFIPVIETVTK